VTKTLFRADSSPTIGLGHIKRDLVYAQRLKIADITFACFENSLELSYPTYQLKTNEVDELITLCQNEAIEHLIIDHYGFNYEDEKKLKEALNITLSVFDDTYKRHYCDEIINHNISADSTKYTLEPFTKVKVISPLIRDEFKQIKQRDRTHKTHEVMICMGGVDSLNLTPKIIPLCQDYQKIHVVTSDNNPHLADLQAMQNITLHINTNAMAELMNTCDLAILTPSVVVHEALYMHLPFIAIKTASNQDDIYTHLKQKGYNVLDDFDEAQLKAYIETEMSSYPLLDFAIRKSMDEDLMPLFDLVNDPLVRELSLSTEAISLSTHTQWFQNSMKDPLILMFTLLDARANFLGQLRFNLHEKGKAIISISLVSSSRGFGLASKVLSQGLKIISKLQPEREVVALIKEANTASIKSFEKAGFKYTKTQEHVLYYTLGGKNA